MNSFVELANPDEMRAALASDLLSGVHTRTPWRCESARSVGGEALAANVRARAVQAALLRVGVVTVRGSVAVAPLLTRRRQLGRERLPAEREKATHPT